MTPKPYELTTSEVDPTDIESALPGHFGRRQAVTTLAFGGGVLVFLVSLVTFGAVTGKHYYDMTKTAEATHELAKISKLSIDAYERGRAEPLVGPTLCKSAPHPVPESLDRVRNRYCMTSITEWNEGEPDQGFRCLRYQMDEPNFYQYDYASTGPEGRFTATARGDLDGDGEASEFAQDGAVDPSRRTVILAPSLRIHSPAE